MQYSQGFNFTRDDIDRMSADLKNKMIRQSRIQIRVKDQNQKHQNPTKFIKRPKGVNV